jgi:hypothetical protein
MLNPRHKKGRKKSSKKSKHRAPAHTRTITKWRTRNPGKPNRGGGMRRARQGLAALDIGAAFRGAVAIAGGMLIAKAAVNKITAGGSETELWSWPNIATAALAGFVAAFVLGAVFNLNQVCTRFIFMGGLALALFKAFTTKLAPKWGWTQTWFGADEDVNPALLGAGAGGGEIDIYEPIPVGDEQYEVVDGYGYGDEGTNQVLQEMGFAGQLSPYNPAMGALTPYNPALGNVSPVNPTMGTSYSPYDPSVTQAAQQLVRGSSAYPGSY